ncbi:MAG TPA: winged helix-turn-helix transcriptional regulator [Burkholderiales bacterium]
MPPRVEYSITEFGKSLDDARTPLSNWAHGYEKNGYAGSAADASAFRTSDSQTPSAPAAAE